MKKVLAILLAGLLTATGLFSQGFDLNFGDFGFGAPGGQSSAADRAAISADMAMMKMRRLTPLRFVNALDGNGISGGTVSIPGIGTYTTDNRGIISFPRHADGNFTLTFSKDSFITTPINFSIKLGMIIFDWFSISPGWAGALRVVLDWGERPSDLDLHFEKERAYHISYQNMHASSDGDVKLDRDDTSGYGPETISASKVDNSAAYSVYVIDYSNLGLSSSQALAKSGATIRVYGNNQLLHTYQVPESGSGTRWNVFKLVNGKVQAVNTIGN
ncbi:YfaP family protein [Breznakiellaceae bacterium SP9]